MFRTNTGLGSSHSFRPRHDTKYDDSIRKSSVASTASTASTSSFTSRSTSISSASTVSSRGTVLGYNPLCLHPPLSVNKPPKVDEDTDVFGNFILEEDEEEDLNKYFGSEKYRRLRRTRTDNFPTRETQFHPAFASRTFAPPPFDPETFARTNHGRSNFSRSLSTSDEDAAHGRRRGSNFEEESPCPDVQWDLEQHIPVDGVGWHKKKRNAKRKAMLLKPESIHTTGTYI